MTFFSPRPHITVRSDHVPNEPVVAPPAPISSTTMVQKSRLIAAINKLGRIMPGAIGECVIRELEFYTADNSACYGPNAFTARLLAAVESLPNEEVWPK